MLAVSLHDRQLQKPSGNRCASGFEGTEACPGSRMLSDAPEHAGHFFGSPWAAMEISDREALLHQVMDSLVAQVRSWKETSHRPHAYQDLCCAHKEDIYRFFRDSGLQVHNQGMHWAARAISISPCLHSILPSTAHAAVYPLCIRSCLSRHSCVGALLRCVVAAWSWCLLSTHALF